MCYGKVFGTNQKLDSPECAPFFLFSILCLFSFIYFLFLSFLLFINVLSKIIQFFFHMNKKFISNFSNLRSNYIFKNDNWQFWQITSTFYVILSQWNSEKFNIKLMSYHEFGTVAIACNLWRSHARFILKIIHSHYGRLKDWELMDIPFIVRTNILIIWIS